MNCARCGAPTEDIPCAACGAEPRVVGRFRLTELLGQGGHGTTWRAVDEQTGEARALKELPLRLGTPDKIVALFRREAAVLSQLQHPGVPVCHDAFEDGTGRGRTMWIVLDLVEGMSLDQELQEHRYDEAEVLRIVNELLGILVYLHGLSPPVVHRDLKPANVIRRPDGSLSLVDFGSVRDALRTELGGSTVAGTFGYMAPEQFAGDADPRTDLYGLGALAVHLLARTPPHKLQDRSGNLEFRPHVAVSPGTARLLDRLLAREIADRPASAAHALELLHRVQAGDDLTEDGSGDVRTDPTPTPAPAPRRLPGPLSPAPGEDLVPAVASTPMRIALMAHARRRMTAADHAAVVSALERGAEAQGQIATLGETLRWSVDATREGGRSVQVTVEPHGDGTRIQLIEPLGSLYGGLYGGLVGGLGGGLGGGLAWAFFLFFGPAAGVVYLLAVLAFAFLLATGFVRRGVRRRHRQARAMVGAVQAHLGGAADAMPAAPPVPSPRVAFLGAGLVVMFAFAALAALAGAPLVLVTVAFTLLVALGSAVAVTRGVGAAGDEIEEASALSYAPPELDDPERTPPEETHEAERLAAARAATAQSEPPERTGS